VGILFADALPRRVCVSAEAHPSSAKRAAIMPACANLVWITNQRAKAAGDKLRASRHRATTAQAATQLDHCSHHRRVFSFYDSLLYRGCISDCHYPALHSEGLRRQHFSCFLARRLRVAGPGDAAADQAIAGAQCRSRAGMRVPMSLESLRLFLVPQRGLPTGIASSCGQAHRS